MIEVMVKNGSKYHYPKKMGQNIIILDKK